MERFRKSDEWASKKYSVKVITFCFKVFLKPTVLKDCPGSHLRLATKQSQLSGGISLWESGIRGISNRWVNSWGASSLRNWSGQLPKQAGFHGRTRAFTHCSTPVAGKLFKQSEDSDAKKVRVLSLLVWQQIIYQHTNALALGQGSPNMLWIISHMASHLSRPLSFWQNSFC